MLTTLYTDASFHHAHKYGGWAVWARSEYGRLVKSGPCPEYVDDSNDAELAAMYAGIYLISQHWPDTERILICSDSQTALEWVLDKPRRKDRTGTNRLQKKIRHLCIKHRLSITPRWVKGHSKAGTAQAYLNRRCDELAKAARYQLQQNG